MLNNKMEYFDCVTHVTITVQLVVQTKSCQRRLLNPHHTDISGILAFLLQYDLNPKQVDGLSTRVEINEKRNTDFLEQKFRLKVKCRSWHYHVVSRMKYPGSQICQRRSSTMNISSRRGQSLSRMPRRTGPLGAGPSLTWWTRSGRTRCG